MNKINGIKEKKKKGKILEKIRIPGILGAFGGRGRSLLEFRALPAPGKFPICAFYGKKKKKPNPTRSAAGAAPGRLLWRIPSSEFQPGTAPRSLSRRKTGNLSGFGGGIIGIWGEFIGIWGNYRDLGAPPPPPRGSRAVSEEKVAKIPEKSGKNPRKPEAGPARNSPIPPPQIPGSGSEGCGNRECSLQKEGKREKGGAGRGPRRRFPPKTVEFWGERGGGSQKFPVFRRKLGFLQLKGRIWGGKGENGIRAPRSHPDPGELAGKLQSFGRNWEFLLFFLFSPQNLRNWFKKRLKFWNFTPSSGIFRAGFGKAPKISRIHEKQTNKKKVEIRDKFGIWPLFLGREGPKISGIS